MDIDVYRDIIDDIANFEFQRYFYSKYKDSKLIFERGSLKNVLGKIKKEGKILLFFLHNNDNALSRRRLDELVDRENDRLRFYSKNFLLLGWSMNSIENNFCDLLAAKIIIVDEAADFVKMRRPAIFAVISSEEGFKCIKISGPSTFPVSGESDDEDMVLYSLLEKKLSSYVFIFNDMTARKYQKWMYEELGDRDFDRYESQELKLLKEKILFALYGPPQMLENQQIGYKDTQNEEAEILYKKILEKNNEFSKRIDYVFMGIIYVCVTPLQEEKEKKKQKDPEYDPEKDFYPAPIFVIRKCKFTKREREIHGFNRNACRIFIDGTGRVYRNWKAYLEENKLPPCIMIYPRDGRYRNAASTLILDESQSPSCSVMTQILNTTDTGAGVLSLVSGIALTASMFTPIGILTIPAITAGVITGGYSVGRNISTLTDRSTHDEDMRFSNSEARAAYFNVAAGAASAIGAGATAGFSRFVRSGATIGETVQTTMTVINGINVFVCGASTVNAFYDTYDQYSRHKETPSPLTIIQLGSSVFFFANSVYNFRTGANMVREIQANTLTEIENNLRSNRHRKTFNKMLKETIRLNGDVQGNAEVISAMRTTSRDEVLAVLTRSNKKFNAAGVRFSAGGGGISLNGVPVDILEFGNAPRSSHSFFFENFPDVPQTTRSNVRFVQRTALNDKISSYFGRLVDPTVLLRGFRNIDETVIPDIIDICFQLTREINNIDRDSIRDLVSFLKQKIEIIIVNFVKDFILRYANEIKGIFQERLLTESTMDVCKSFGFEDQHPSMNDFVKYCINKVIHSDGMDRLLLDFCVWLSRLRADEERRQQNRNTRCANVPINRDKQKCKDCGAHYYKPIGRIASKKINYKENTSLKPSQ